MNRKIQIFLNSPWGVLALVVCASLVVYINVVQPMINDSDNVSVDADELEFDDFTELEMDGAEDLLDQRMEVGTERKNLLLPENRIDFSSLTWVGGSIRDPFTPSPHVSVVASNQKKGVKAKPVLTAIIVGDTNFAVLDGEVVTKGNTVGKFIVASIEQASISLKGPKGSVVINLDGRQQ